MVDHGLQADWDVDKDLACLAEERNLASREEGVHTCAEHAEEDIATCLDLDRVRRVNMEGKSDSPD